MWLFFKKKVVERDAKIRAELAKLDSYGKAIEEIFDVVCDLDARRSELIVLIASNLNFTYDELLAFGELGYENTFAAQKIKRPDYDKEKIEAFEEELKQTIEELKILRGKIENIKKDEQLYKDELEIKRLKREKGIHDDEDETNSKKKKTLEEEENIDDSFFEIDSEIDLKPYFSDDPILNLFQEEDDEEDDEEENEEKDDEIIIEEYNKEEKNEENEENDENDEDDEEENEEEEDDEIKKLNIDNFLFEEEDLMDIDTFIKNFQQNEYYTKEEENEEEDEEENDYSEEKIEDNANFFSDYGSKYKSRIIETRNDYIDLQDKDIELYKFFSKYINKEQIIEIFELIF